LVVTDGAAEGRGVMSSSGGGGLGLWWLVIMMGPGWRCLMGARGR
jgi:hypothetical protein